MEGLRQLPTSANEAYKALGNAVNVKVVKWVAQALLAGGAAAEEYIQHEPEPLLVAV
jgi:hypothetical protein